MKTCFCCALAAFAPLSLAQVSPQDDFVLSGPTAYGMLGPEPIAGNTVTSLDWSDDGKYLIALRSDSGSPSAVQSLLMKTQDAGATTEESIVTYSLADRKPTVVWRDRVSSRRVEEVSWFRGSDTAIAIIVETLRTTDLSNPNPTRSNVVLIDARAGTAQTILSVDQEDGRPGLSFALSPSKPFGLIVLSDFEQEPAQPGQDRRPGVWHFQYRAVSAAGAVSGLVKIDDGAFVGGWLADGASPIIQQFKRGADGKIIHGQQALDIGSGRLTPVAVGTKPFEERPPVAPIDVGPAAGSLTLKRKERRVHPSWLISADGESQALVAGDVSVAKLSPTLSAVAYISQGVALVRPILQMPRDAFLQALKAAEKARLMSNAKQLALGLLIYATDSDDVLPSNQEDINKILEPYVKDTGLFSGFVYTFGGGLITDVAEPASTIVGYVVGAGGKAVIYLDGHVKWQNDQ